MEGSGQGPRRCSPESHSFLRVCACIRFPCGLDPQVLYSTPPCFLREAVDAVRRGAAALFQTLQLRDCVRVDGWYLPAASLSGQAARRRCLAGAGRREDLLLEDGSVVVFSDINLASGMEQTSFLFQQAALVCEQRDVGWPMPAQESRCLGPVWQNQGNAGCFHAAPLLWGSVTPSSRVCLSLWVLWPHRKDLSYPSSQLKGP